MELFRERFIAIRALQRIIQACRAWLPFAAASAKDCRRPVLGCLNTPASIVDRNLAKRGLGIMPLRLSCWRTVSEGRRHAADTAQQSAEHHTHCKPGIILPQSHTSSEGSVGCAPGHAILTSHRPPRTDTFTGPDPAQCPPSFLVFPLRPGPPVYAQAIQSGRLPML